MPESTIPEVQVFSFKFRGVTVYYGKMPNGDFIIFPRQNSIIIYGAKGFVGRREAFELGAFHVRAPFPDMKGTPTKTALPLKTCYRHQRRVLARRVQSRRDEEENLVKYRPMIEKNLDLEKAILHHIATGEDWNELETVVRKKKRIRRATNERPRRRRRVIDLRPRAVPPPPVAEVPPPPPATIDSQDVLKDFAARALEMLKTEMVQQIRDEVRKTVSAEIASAVHPLESAFRTAQQHAQHSDMKKDDAIASLKGRIEQLERDLAHHKMNGHSVRSSFQKGPMTLVGNDG